MDSRLGHGPVLIVLGNLALAACSATPVAGTSSLNTPPLTQAVENSSAAVAPVEVTFAAAGNDDSPVEPAGDERDQIERQVASRVESELAAAGLAVHPAITSEAWDAAGLDRRGLTRIHTEKSELAPPLRQLQAQIGAEAIAIADVVVRIGRSGMYEPVFGTVRSGTHSTTITVTLVSAETGEHIWRRRAFVRKQPDESTLRELLDIIFDPSTLEE